MLDIYGRYGPTHALMDFFKYLTLFRWEGNAIMEDLLSLLYHRDLSLLILREDITSIMTNMSHSGSRDGAIRSNADFHDILNFISL